MDKDFHAFKISQVMRACSPAGGYDVSEENNAATLLASETSMRPTQAVYKSVNYVTQILCVLKHLKCPGRYAL